MTWALLISLFVKSSLVAGAGLACARFVAWRAVDRVDILRATVCLLLALPIITALLPSIDLAILPPLPVEAPPAAFEAVKGEALPPDVVDGPSWSLPFAVLGGAWALGAALITGQLLLGLRTLGRWTQAGRPVTCPDWRAPIERLPLARRPRLVSSERVMGPLSWGLAPGAIVVDPATLTERQAAPAIMAHELAHLRRRDWLFLVLSRMALALFWFNPLVWRLHAVLAERSEEAADAAALRSVDRTLYARTLVRLAAYPVPGAATAMAADARTLKTRIACIMTNTSDRRRPLTLGLTVLAMAAIATPLAALGLSRQHAPPVPPVPPAPMAVIAPPAPPAPPSELVAPPAPPEPPVPPATFRGVRIHSSYRAPTAAEIAAADAAQDQAEQARIQADQARVLAADARRQADEVRRDADARRAEADVARRQADEGRRQADAGRRMADQQRVPVDIARAQAEGARIAGEQARKAGERARIDAAKQMVQARAQMAAGAVQMRQGARDMREEGVRLRDPAYRAKQIEESRARGDDVTDEQLRALADRLPTQADRMERQADRLAARAQNPS